MWHRSVRLVGPVANNLIKSRVSKNGLQVVPRARFSSSSRMNRKKIDPITLTESAAGRIKMLLTDKPDSLGVKVGVRRRGCNGYSYTMNYAEKDEEGLEKFEPVDAHGVRVYVDPKAVFFLVGTAMDYVETPLSAEFTFTNPNSKGSCGCGESFNV